MEWKNWLMHDDGTPRAMYRKLSDQAELVLIESLDGCEAKIELTKDVFRHVKVFRIETENRITDTAIQAWAETKAVTYLDMLAKLARAASDAIKER